MAGYSGTPLAKKLGIKEGHRVAVLGAPPAFEALLAPLPDDVRILTTARGGAEVVLLFTKARADLLKRFPAAMAAIPADGALWVAWPKKSSGVATDLTEDRIREVALAAGLVDNKVCAIDDTWSGLRLVVRLADRARWPR
jgi:hypothetical protein